MRARAMAVALILVAMSALPVSAQTAKALSPVIVAAKSGDAASVRALVAKKADVNAAEPDGTTALHWAVRADDQAVVDILLRAGADANRTNRYGVAPLPLAASNGNPAMVGALLKAGARPDSAIGAGETALMAAARVGSLQTVRLLLVAGADANAAEGAFGQTALMFAAIENHADVVTALAEAGANLNAVSLQIETPDVKLATNVVSDGARGSFPKGGMTPLLLAARHGSLEAARALAKAGATLDQPQSEGITPLIMAIFNAHYDVATALVELGADVNKGDSANRTPLYMAVDMHRLEWLFSRPTPRASGLLDSVDVVKLLLAKGAKPDARLTKRPPAIGIGGSGHNVNLTNGATPLMKAASSSDVELIRILLAAGADPHLTTDNHTTPLMMSAGLSWRDIGSLGSDEESLEAMKIFIDLGADVDAFNDEGMTALHGAAQRGSLPILKFLLAQGAKPSVKNARNRTPLDEAKGDDGLGGERRQGRPEAVTLLTALSAGAPSSAGLRD